MAPAVERAHTTTTYFSSSLVCVVCSVLPTSLVTITLPARARCWMAQSWYHRPLVAPRKVAGGGAWTSAHPTHGNTRGVRLYRSRGVNCTLVDRSLPRHTAPASPTSLLPARTALSEAREGRTALDAALQ
eukprot:scaffold13088_cov56-Phaeocystis_antarctica.AAC.12